MDVMVLTDKIRSSYIIPFLASHTLREGHNIHHCCVGLLEKITHTQDLEASTTFYDKKQRRKLNSGSQNPLVPCKELYQETQPCTLTKVLGHKLPGVSTELGIE